MEIIKRKIEAEKEVHNSETMSCSVNNDDRLCCRWHNKGDDNNDIIVNFTQEETNKIKRLFRRDC